MTGANEIYDTIMRELNSLVLSDTNEIKEEQESFSLHDEADFNDIPPSLLSYFETSRSRAADCEKLILEEFEDFESHHTQDTMNVPIDLDNDMMKINEQVGCDTQNEENDTSTYTRLLPAPTETKAPFIHNVSLCHNNEDEAGTDECMESEKHFAFEVRTLEISLNEEGRKKNSEYKEEREKWQCEEKKMEQKRQIERDFQKELKKIMEAEKLHQKELELMQKKAQEKLEQELLLQQKLFINLRRQVEEERKMREEEQKRMKDEEDKRKREEETERSRMEEERRRKKEEDRKMECMTLKNKEERKNEEEEKRIIEREEKRTREEEGNKIDVEKKKLEDEMRMMKQEEEGEMKKEVERLKKEEERKMIGEARKKLEKEKRKLEEEMILKKEEERKKREEESMRIEEEGRITEEIEERKKQVEMRKNKEEEDADDRKKVYKEMRKRDIKKQRNVEEELEEKKKKQENERKKREKKEDEEEEEKEEKNEDGRKREKERKKMEEKTEVKEVVRKREGEHKKMKEELRPIEEDEERKNEDKRKTKEGKQRRRQEEEMRRQRDDEYYIKSGEEIRLKKEKEGYKGCGVDNRKIENESKTKDKEKKQEEKRKREEEIIKVEAGENKKEGNKKTEEIIIKEKEESTKRMVHDREKEESVNRENEWQEKRKKSMIGQNEKKNVDKTKTSLASQLEDRPTWTSSSPGSLHSESTVCPTITRTVPQQHDLDKISQASIDKTGTSLTSQLEDSSTWTSANPRSLRSKSTICPTNTGTVQQQYDLNKISQASIDKTESSLTSQLEDSPTWTSANPDSLCSESTICPTNTGAVQQQYDLNKISQASIDKTGTSLTSQLEDSSTWTSANPRVLRSKSTICPTNTGAVQQQYDLNKISQASIDKTESSLASQLEDSPTSMSENPGSLRSESTICAISTGIVPHELDNISQASVDKTVACENQAARPSTVSVSLPMCLPQHTEEKRLSWMKDCIPWSKLCLQNRRKQKGSMQSRRGQRRAAEPSSLPPLCPDSLLRSTGLKSLQEVTAVTLEDLPGCSLSTLAQCIQLRSLTLRRCGLKSLEGINQLPQLCHIDVQENDISFVDCENMTNLQILQLGHNKMTSIHGLTGAENLDVLDLSYNSITRIAGLESMRRLQRLSVDHNQLISTKGLREVYTLLHLSCSHNHLASVEGLENSALLNTLDLRANSLTEPPSLNNQVLLRELHLDDNSISSLTELSACWLPHMQHLSVAQNRITQLPSMFDFVSLANLDLRFNCLSELQNVCESLQGCQFLREVHLTGNPLQQESGWRSTLQRAVPGLRAIDKQETDSFLSPPAVQQVSLAIGSFLTFCQAQLQQTHDLQQRHNRELSNASSSLDAVKTSCRHFTEALQLAKDQRFAHEYGDTTVADKCRAAGQTTPKETLNIDSTNAEEVIEYPEMESTGKIPPVIPDRNNIKCSYWTFEANLAAESQHDTFDTDRTGRKTGPLVRKANSGSVHSLTTKGKTIFSNLEMAPVSNHQDLDLQNTAAVMIQQLWRKYRQKCGNISSPSTADKGGGRGGTPESGPSYINGSQDYAATVIQAFWRGFTLRRKLTSALAAVTCLDTGEDDTFEEVDVDEFVFDEAALKKHWTLPLSEDSPPRCYPGSEQPLSLKAALEKHWTLPLSEDSPPRCYPGSEQPLSLKPPGSFPEPSQYISPPPLVRGSKQAWVAGGQVDCASPVGSIRSKYPASASVVSGLSERSEKILEEWGFNNSNTALLMLKRAQKMKSKKQQEKKRRDPIVRLALFRNCSYQLCPVEAPNRHAQYSRTHIKVREVELGLQQPEKTERAQQERAQQWLHTQAAQSDRDSESVHFLPEINSDILNGGRVQLVADSGYTEPQHYASGLWANNSLAAQSCKDSSYPRRNPLNHASKEVPSPNRVTSAPSKKERISFRDNPVQLSGGWGGGKKMAKVYK